MNRSRIIFRPLPRGVIAPVVAAACLISAPALAQQRRIDIDLSRLSRALGLDSTAVIVGPGARMIAGGTGTLIDETIAHGGKNWHLSVTGNRAADSTAPVRVTFNGDVVKLDSTGAATVTPTGGPQITFSLKGNSLSFQYSNNQGGEQWLSDVAPGVNLIAIRLAPESELVTQVAQLQGQLGGIQERLRSSPVAAPSDSAQVAAGFRIHLELNEVKELLKRISADLDAVK